MYRRIAHRTFWLSVCLTASGIAAVCEDAVVTSYVLMTAGLFSAWAGSILMVISESKGEGK